MKLLLLSEVFPPQVGGSGRWLWELYRRLPADRVAVIAGDSQGSLEFDSHHDLALRRLKFAFGSWGCWGPVECYRYARFAHQTAKQVRYFGVESIHAARVLPEGWVAYLLWRSKGIPYWIYVHGEEINIVRKSRQLTWMMKRVLGAAQGIVVNSNNTARVLRDASSVNSDSVHLLYPGVDARRFCPAPRDEALRARLGWAGRQVILVVGRLQRRKGQDMLIRALPEIKLCVPDALCCIVGGGQRLEELRSLALSEGVQQDVQFVGEADEQDLLSFYQQCDLFVLPNREVKGDFEGFGMVLVEAQACGKPVIAGASGGTSETMVPGRTGLVVDCSNPYPLASAVSEILNDGNRREAMGAAGRELVVSRFDWRVLAEQAEAKFWHGAEGGLETSTARGQGGLDL